MTSSGRRKKHGLATEKSTGRGTAPTVAKNMGYRRKKHHRRRKHTLPMQKTWPAVAKNMPSHQDRRKKHPPPLQKTPPTGTVAKNTKTSHRRKKHELPTQKTRNPQFFLFCLFCLLGLVWVGLVLFVLDLFASSCTAANATKHHWQLRFWISAFVFLLPVLEKNTASVKKILLGSKIFVGCSKTFSLGNSRNTSGCGEKR